MLWVKILMISLFLFELFCVWIYMYADIASCWTACSICFDFSVMNSVVYHYFLFLLQLKCDIYNITKWIWLHWSVYALTYVDIPPMTLFRELVVGIYMNFNFKNIRAEPVAKWGYTKIYIFWCRLDSITFDRIKLHFSPYHERML